MHQEEEHSVPEAGTIEELNLSVMIDVLRDPNFWAQLAQLLARQVKEEVVQVVVKEVVTEWVVTEANGAPLPDDQLTELANVLVQDLLEEPDEDEGEKAA